MDMTLLICSLDTEHEEKESILFMWTDLALLKHQVSDYNARSFSLPDLLGQSECQ